MLYLRSCVNLYFTRSTVAKFAPGPGKVGRVPGSCWGSTRNLSIYGVSNSQAPQLSTAGVNNQPPLSQDAEKSTGVGLVYDLLSYDCSFTFIKYGFISYDINKIQQQTKSTVVNTSATRVIM